MDIQIKLLVNDNMDVKHQYWLDTWMFNQPFHHENRKKKSQNLELHINMTEFKPLSIFCVHTRLMKLH